MAIHHIGIVLHNYAPHIYKIALFDRELGYVEAIAESKRITQSLVRGSLIQYVIEEKISVCSIDSIELLAIPFELARSDITFLHYVLELCLYCIPKAQVSYDIFDLILQLFVRDNTVWENIHKKIFLCRFFAYVGLFPEDDCFQTTSFYRLIYGSVEGMFKENLDETELQAIDKLLSRCILMHPKKDQLKLSYYMGQQEVL